MAAPNADWYVIVGSRAFGTIAANWTQVGGINQAPFDGSIMYALVVVTGTVTGVPAGWGSPIQSGTQGGVNWYLYRKVAGPSENVTLSFSTATSGTDNAMLAAIAFNIAGTQSVEATVATGGSGSPAVANGLTIPADSNGGSVAALIGGFGGGVAWSTPTGYTSAGSTAGGTGNQAGRVAFLNGRSAGEVIGTASSTSSGTSDWVAVQVAASDLAPPPVGLIWLESFEAGFTLDDKVNAQGSTAVTGGIDSTSTTTPKTGNKKWTASYPVNLGGADRDDLVIAGYWGEVGPAVGNNIAFIFGADGFNQVVITLNKTGGGTFTIRAYLASTGGTLIGESADLGALPAAGTWAHIEAKVRLHDSTGSVEVRWNETSVLALTGVDTHNAGASATFDQVQCTGAWATNTAGYGIDDVYIANEQGATSDFLGAIRVPGLKPSGNGNSSQGAGSDGNSTDNYLLVDDIPTVSTADYVAFNTLGDKDTYAHEDLSYASTLSAKGVFVWAYSEKTDAGARTITPVARLSGTEQDGAALSLVNGTYAWMGDVYETKPGGGAWTVADVNAAEYGAKGTTNVRMAAEFVEVALIVPAAAFVPPLQVGHHGTHLPPGIAGPPLRAGPAAGGQFSPQVQRGHRY